MSTPERSHTKGQPTEAASTTPELFQAFQGSVKSCIQEVSDRYQVNLGKLICERVGFKPGSILLVHTRGPGRLELRLLGDAESVLAQWERQAAESLEAIEKDECTSRRIQRKDNDAVGREKK